MCWRRGRRREAGHRRRGQVGEAARGIGEEGEDERRGVDEEVMYMFMFMYVHMSIIMNMHMFMMLMRTHMLVYMQMNM